MSGQSVTLLQFYLVAVGYPTQVDGQFQTQTRNSVVSFQRSYGLHASGVVTPKVGRALGGAVAAVDSVHTGKTWINQDGTGRAPGKAPAAVKAAVAAANQIINTSYCYAGGHGSWKSSCYDCSGSVSYALHGAHLLPVSEDSTQMETYGSPGPGHWITIYADSSHVFIVIAGRAFDTADFGGPNRPAGDGPRWRWNPTGNLQDGGNYVVRHPPGL